MMTSATQRGKWLTDFMRPIWGAVFSRSGLLDQGKRGGFRTMIASNRKDRWVFLYGFAKNERSNISGKEQEALRKLAGDLLIATPKTIETMTLNNKLMEVDCDEEN
jgi:hypothetical protein